MTLFKLSFGMYFICLLLLMANSMEKAKIESSTKSDLEWFNIKSETEKQVLLEAIAVSSKAYKNCDSVEMEKEMEKPAYGLSAKQTKELCEYYLWKKKNDEDSIRNRVVFNTLINIYDRAEANFKLPDECVVCYYKFPVSFKFSCGHEVCAVCVESIMDKCVSKNCPKCRKPLPKRSIKAFLPLIKIYPLAITPDIPVEKLQRAFPLICYVANLATVTKCVNMGVNVGTKGFAKYFPLHFMAEYVLHKEEKMNKENNAVTSVYGLLPVVRYLINNGADVNPANKKCKTPLYASCYGGNLPLVEYLINNGANVNPVSSSGKTPLSIAIGKNHTEIAKLLLRKGANIEIAKLFWKEHKLLKPIDFLDKLCKEIKDE